MALSVRMVLILSAGVTFGASLNGLLHEVQTREQAEMDAQWGFRDLFEWAEAKFSHLWNREDPEENVEKAERLSKKSRREKSGDDDTHYVATYGGDLDFAFFDLCDVDVTSNLGGEGPQTGAREELRYSKVATANGVGEVDFVIKATSAYKAHNISANGRYNCFGIVNVASTLEGTNTVDLEMGFVETGTETKVAFSKVYFTIYDMDTAAKGSAVEKVTLYGDAHSVKHEDDCLYDSEGDLDDEDGQTYTATEEGYGSDNPNNPAVQTDMQRRKSFTATYLNKSTWKVSFGVKGGTGGRNFMFAGESPHDEGKVCRVEGDCLIYGDPHVITFDATQKLAAEHPTRREFFQTRNRKAEEVNVFDEGNFWLVKSKDVHIQGRYNKRKEHSTKTVLGGLAVGGPFLKDNTLIFRPLTGKITWNGKEILKHLGSRFSNHLVQAKYHKGAESVNDGRKGDGIDVTLPGNVKLTVNRFERGLAVKISMCKQKWQDGQCGNFNGDVSDDTQEFLMSHVKPIHNKAKLPWREHRHLATAKKSKKKAKKASLLSLSP